MRQRSLAKAAIVIAAALLATACGSSSQKATTNPPLASPPSGAVPTTASSVDGRGAGVTTTSPDVPLMTPGVTAPPPPPPTLHLRAPATVQRQATFTVRSVDPCPTGPGSQVFVTATPTRGGTSVSRVPAVKADGSWSARFYLGGWAAGLGATTNELAEPGPVTVAAYCATNNRPTKYYHDLTVTLTEGGPGAQVEARRWATAGSAVTVTSLVGCPDPTVDDGAVYLVLPGQNPDAPSTRPLAYQPAVPIDRATGTWQLEITVPATTTPGTYALAPECINRGGTDLRYTPVPITVTAR